MSYTDQILDNCLVQLSEDVLKIVKMDVDENPNTARAFWYHVYPYSSLQEEMDKLLNKF